MCVDMTGTSGSIVCDLNMTEMIGNLLRGWISQLITGEEIFLFCGLLKTPYPETIPRKGLVDVWRNG